MSGYTKAEQVGARPPRVTGRAWSLAVRARDRICRYETIASIGAWRGCTEPSTQAHHVYTRGRAGKSINEMWNGLGLCLWHHDWVHAHPIEALALGLMAKLRAYCDIEPVGASDRVRAWR